MDLSSLTSTVIGKVALWVIGILVVVITGLSVQIYFLKSNIFILNKDATIAKKDLLIANAEKISDDLQKDALRKAIIDQSDAVEKQRINAEKRAAKFEAESKQIWSDFERTKSEVQNLSGDVECEAMRKIVREAVR